jgi:hypothetical protein
LLGALQCNPVNSARRGCGIVLVDSGSGTMVRRWPDTEDDIQFLPFQPPLNPLKPVLDVDYRHPDSDSAAGWRTTGQQRSYKSGYRMASG